MGGRLLRAAAAPAAAAGFTLIETMVALALAMVVLLANLMMFSTAHKNLAAARALTGATDAATAKIADFRAMTVAQIVATAPTALPNPNPLGMRRGTDTVTVDGIGFTRTWVVSSVDLEHDGTPDLAGDVVKITLEVTWTAGNRSHRVAMATFTTGKQS